MPYTATTFNSGAAPGIDAAVLNAMQTQYSEAMNSFEADFMTAFVLLGGVCTIHGGLPKQMDVTGCTYFAVQATDSTLRKRVVSATNFTTVTASTTYFLDYNPDGTTSWGTAHSGTANYVPIASVTTDGSGNISVITDARPTVINLFAQAVGLLQFDSQFVARFGTGGQKAPVNFTIGNVLPTSGMVKGDAHILAPFPLP